MRAKVRGYALLALAGAACPCHLPALLALLGGTALGAALAAYLPLVLALLSAVFVAALLLGLQALRAPAGSGAACPPVAPAARPRGGPSTAEACPTCASAAPPEEARR